MATLNNYKHTTSSERKQLVEWLEGQESFWLKYTGNTWYDDGHDESDINDIVACIRDGIDQGTSKTLRDYIKSGASLEDARHMKVPKWEPYEPKKPKVKATASVLIHETGEYGNVPEVTRTINNIGIISKPYVPPKPPKWYTNEEDCQEVEHWISIIESIDNIEIIRTPESVKRIARWIRQDEHLNYRSKNPISCIQVRDILKEFEK